MAGSGLSWFRIELLDDRGVCERSEKRLGRTPDSNEVVLLLETSRGGSSAALDGLSTGRVFALTRGFGPREKFCVPRTFAAFGGCEVGKRVKLECAGEVARRRGTGTPFAARNG